VTEPDVARIVLVGFMASGKSAVGRRLAHSMGWAFVDFDDAIVEEAGASIPQIFGSEGEAGFREIESRVADRLLGLDQVVLASGGGWAAVPGRLGTLPEGTLSVWLRVSVSEALRRASEAPGTRPLLVGEEAPTRAEELLAAREVFYASAGLEVDTEGRSVEDVSADILDRLASRAP
jgi:shikimate kinase